MERDKIKKEQEVLDQTVDKIENQIYSLSKSITRRREKIRRGHQSVGDAFSLGNMDHRKYLLDQVLDKPYFGKLEIVSEEEGEETFYIGEQGVYDEKENMIIIDWRRPIASVFYNFVPGENIQSYEVPKARGNESRRYTVDVKKKLEINIKKQRIKQIIQHMPDLESLENITITETGERTRAKDEFLKEIIENSETTGYLKKIISTLQREQDLAIRQPIDKNVIVQGVAGSGKSSIALHRLSFLLFNNPSIQPQNFLIVGPSPLFLSSVKGLLPELDLDGVPQRTVHELFIENLAEDITSEVANPYKKYFEEVLFTGDFPDSRRRVNFRASKQLSIVIDIFIEELKTNFINRIETINLFGQSLSSNSLYTIYNGYRNLPLGEISNKMIEYINQYFNRIVNQKIAEVNNRHNEVAKHFRHSKGLLEGEKDTVFRILQKATNHERKEINKEFQRAKKQWTNRYKIDKAEDLYKQIMTYEILSMFENEIGREIPSLFQKYSIKKLTYFDLAPILYIHTLIHEPRKKYKHIVIDEAQDLSYLHFAVLNKLTDTMTILGDKEQSIFMEYGQYDWEELMNFAFNPKEDSLLPLEISYRSTREIIGVANTVLKNKLEEKHKDIHSLSRQGKEVNIMNMNNAEELLDQIHQQIISWQKSYKRIAIIHKDEKRAQALANHLETMYSLPVKYVKADDNSLDSPISIIASYNSKGMEFDAVMLINVNEENYPKDTLHARLLYVLLTRAQHESAILYVGRPSRLLEGLVQTRTKKASNFDNIL